MRLTDEVLDRAVAARQLQFGRFNRRAVRCVVEGCARLVPPGHAEQVIIEGRVVGFACEHCLGYNLEGVTP